MTFWNPSFGYYDTGEGSFQDEYCSPRIVGKHKHPNHKTGKDDVGGWCSKCMDDGVFNWIYHLPCKKHGRDIELLKKP